MPQSRILAPISCQFWSILDHLWPKTGSNRPLFWGFQGHFGPLCQTKKQNGSSLPGFASHPRSAWGREPRPGDGAFSSPVENRVLAGSLPSDCIDEGSCSIDFDPGHSAAPPAVVRPAGSLRLASSFREPLSGAWLRVGRPVGRDRWPLRGGWVCMVAGLVRLGLNFTTGGRVARLGLNFPGEARRSPSSGPSAGGMNLAWPPLEVGISREIGCESVPETRATRRGRGHGPGVGNLCGVVRSECRALRVSRGNARFGG